VTGNGNGLERAPRWLDADERRIWLGWVFTSRLLWEEVERDLQRESGFSYGHYEILVMLSETPSRSRRMSELADATQSSRSRLSHAVARLEELGWVRRETCSTDRRGQLAILTDEGFAALRDAAPGHVESVRRHFFDQLSPEQLDALADIQTTMLDHLLPLANARGDVRTKVLEEARAQLER
jgi:DNA-binding MarR family transcriptional regulator